MRSIRLTAREPLHLRSLFREHCSRLASRSGVAKRRITRRHRISFLHVPRPTLRLHWASTPQARSPPLKSRSLSRTMCTKCSVRWLIQDYAYSNRRQVNTNYVRSKSSSY